MTKGTATEGVSEETKRIMERLVKQPPQPRGPRKQPKEEQDRGLEVDPQNGLDPSKDLPH